MKILFVAIDYPDRGKAGTGFHSYLHRVTTALYQKGHEPVILAAGNRESRRIEDGVCIRTVRVSYKKYNSQLLNYVINALNVGYTLNRKINELLSKEKFDIIQFTSLYGVALFYRGKIPAVLRLSSYAKTSFSSFSTYDKVTVGAMALLERMSAKTCKAVFAPCMNTAYAFGNDTGRKVKVIETPFVNDVSEYDNTCFEQYLSGKKYVLFFGTLYAEKGILVIAEILEEFLREYPDYFFVFIGTVTVINGESAKSILLRAAGKFKERVVILGALPHTALYPVIQSADFVVLPSLMDNFPNACIEAMYFGKVVIGTDGASFEQLITHGENGLLCRIGDSSDLLDKMHMAVSLNADDKHNMGMKAKKRIYMLRPESVVNRLLSLYEYVISNSSK